MKQTYTWLLVAALLALLSPSALFAADGTELSSSVEVGATSISADDAINKVNEYSSIGDKDGEGAYIKMHLEGGNDSSHAAFDAEIMSDDDVNVNLDFDAARIFRLDTSYQKFNHWQSHDQIDYLDATMKSQGQTSSPSSANPAVYGEDLVPDQDFFVIHKELEMEGKVVVPSLPNVTLKAGYRAENRQGVEQVFGMSHCSSCHIEGDAKTVDETTTDVTIGATGKFGMFTVDYEYLTREFEENSEAMMREYLVAGKPFPGYDVPKTGLADFGSARLLYDGYYNEALPYSQNPESEKDSHSLKARYDLPNAVISGGYVTAEIESNKQDDDGRTLMKNELSTEYDSYNLRASTRLGGWKLTGYGRHEKLEGSENTIAFTYANGNDVPVTDDRATYESEESREVTTLGGNAVFRIKSGTSVRLGYEFEEIDRELEEAQDTESHTLKASVRFRPSKKLNGRASYTYQSIDDQFMHPHGNKGPIAEDFSWPADTPPKRWYEEYFYAQREAEATNLPESVHEVKVSTTWAGAPNYSFTAYARYRMEENDLNFSTYEQDSFSPGANFWWAPLNNLNMTMAYNFNKMETENQMCVGWYHG